MIVSFASLRRFNKDVDLTLVTNTAPPEEFLETLVRLGVRTKVTGFAHLPPEGFSHRFTASLYLLDALTVLDGGVNILVDPDVLCIRPLEDLVEATHDTVGVLPIDYSVTHNINGISRLQAGELHGLLGEPAESPTHYGGEVYVIPRKHLAETLARSERAWVFTLLRHSQGLSKFFTEEHLLSFAFRGVPRTDIQQFTRRIWTAHRLRQVNGRESDLTLWHLPAEKDRGFSALYSEAIDPGSWFWTADPAEFVSKAGRAMGLHHRGPRRIALDAAGRTVEHVRRPRGSR